MYKLEIFNTPSSPIFTVSSAKEDTFHNGHAHTEAELTIPLG